MYKVIKIFKHKRKIIGFIRESEKGFSYCNGKPSDACVVSWDYKTIEEAEERAKEQISLRTDFILS